MKMEIMIKIKDDDGNEVIKPVLVDEQIPSFNDFDTPENFLKVFHKYEKAVLKIRNESVEITSERFLEELSKKNR